MLDSPAAREVAVRWRPQRHGGRALKDIPDPIVEPAWGGLKAAAALTVDDVSLLLDGEELPVAEDLHRALLDGFRAIDAVIEGHLTTEAFQTGEGAFAAGPKVERLPILLPRRNRTILGDDPQVFTRDHTTRSNTVAMQTLAALERGEPHAFVATDLLWLDGESLLDVPLLERKRHLEAILDESLLVRVSAFVRPSAKLTLVSWGSLGFQDLLYKAANSRYRPGEVNPDWTVVRAPDASTGPPNGSSPPR